MCKDICIGIVITVFIAKIFKRFCFRKRPSMVMPTRAVYYTSDDRTSSFMSQTIMMGFMLGRITYGWIGAISLLAISFIFKVHSGSIFPSDGLLTIPMCFVNLLIFFLAKFVKDKIPDDDSKIKLSRYNIQELNQVIQDHFAIIWAVLVIVIVILISMLRPIYLFKKTPLWMSCPLSIWLFHRIVVDHE